MPRYDLRDRVTDADAIGPQQYNVTQHTFMQGKPAFARADPLPADWSMARMSQADNGNGYYEELAPDNDGWRLMDEGFGMLFQNETPL